MLEKKVGVLLFIVAIIAIHLMKDAAMEENKLKLGITLIIFGIAVFFGGYIFYKKKLNIIIIEKYKKLKSLEYYYILEKNQKTEKKIRKELIDNIKQVGLVVIFIILIIISAIKLILNIENNNMLFSLIILSIEILIIIFLIITFAYKNAIISFFILPIILSLFVVKNTSTEYSLYFFIYNFVVYFLIVLIYPSSYLRKIEDNVAIWISIIMILITISGNYYLELKVNLSDKEIEYIKFLLGSAYAIEIVLIKLKLKKWENKAKEYYNNILYRSEKIDIYQECKRCIYYGGEEYANRILDNKNIRELIIENEEKFKNKVDLEIYSNKEERMYLSFFKKIRDIYRKYK